MRKALFATMLAGGIAPFAVLGCASKSGPTYANNNTSSDWFGVKKLAGLFKSDKGQMSSSDVADPQDPTSLAHKGKPPGADLYVATAKIAESQKNTAGAEEQYKLALNMSPTDLAALLGYAHLLDRQGKLDQATAYYQQAVQHHPQDPSAHNDLGLCYARRGMFNESLVELSKAVELEPSKKLYRNNIATVFVELGQPQHALEHLSVAEQPAVAHYNLACLLQQRGQTQAAAGYFAQAARLDPSLARQSRWPQTASMPAAQPRIGNVRRVGQSTPQGMQGPSSPVATAQVGDQPPGSRFNGSPVLATQSGSASYGGSPLVGPQAQQPVGADRNWSAYDVSSPSGNIASGDSLSGVRANDAQRGSAYAMPPTPESMNSYALPVSSVVDTLPPVEQPTPRY